MIEDYIKKIMSNIAEVEQRLIESKSRFSNLINSENIVLFLLCHIRSKDEYCFDRIKLGEMLLIHGYS